jgi:hypothetical protein
MIAQGKLLHVGLGAMQPDEGIEHEQTRLQPSDSFLEACAVDIQIEAQAGRGDHLDVEVGQRDPGGVSTRM